MYDRNKVPYHEYKGEHRVRIWFWDDKERDASKLYLNNLSVRDDNDQELWNMKEAVGYDDVCVGCSLLENTFTFVTFSGIRYTIDLQRFQVLRKQITK